MKDTSKTSLHRGHNEGNIRQRADGRWEVRLSAGIHKRQSHTQHNAIYRSCTETADFTGGAFLIDVQVQILVDHNIAQLIAHQRVGIALEPARYLSDIAIGKVILSLTQQGKRLIGECAFPFVLFLFILQAYHAVLPGMDIFDRPSNTVTLLTQISQFRFNIINVLHIDKVFGMSKDRKDAFFGFLSGLFRFLSCLTFRPYRLRFFLNTSRPTSATPLRQMITTTTVSGKVSCVCGMIALPGCPEALRKVIVPLLY